MSKHVIARRKTVPDIINAKGDQKIVCLTAYTAAVAAILDEHCDLLLVGDSLGMVMHGLENPIGVTLDMMIMHAKAVMRGAQKSLVVVDLPFGSFEESPQVAYRTAARVMQEVGCQAVKVESSEVICDSIAYIVERGIPVMAHVGLRPQAFNVDGGFKAKGKTDDSRKTIIAEAKAAEAAGAFAMVIEGVAKDLATEITQSVGIPTIGIGASAECDGQILVTDDMLGMSDWTPKFVRQYGSLKQHISDAVAQYKNDVISGDFPNDDEMYFTKK